ncbi:esterase-like activity of phytase family protein [Spongiactinospora sp. 9N601]|uniref:esterase-like activity of phytase family protein n=1 Tax=Spongiactinospora sp. 9N601 TaxID=3375149 RepID=UPI0037989C48
MSIRATTRQTAAFVIAIPLALATTAATAPSLDVSTQFAITRLLGEQTIPYGTKLEDTDVGSLSGLDFDPATGTWYFLADDHWSKQAPRFYTGSLTIDPQAEAFTGVKLTKHTWLKQHDGSDYPKYGEKESPDPESIRYDPATKRLLWASEAHQPSAHNPNALSQPAVHWMTPDGKEDLNGKPVIPGNLLLGTGNTKGTPSNGGFEALTLTPTGIAAMIEHPAYQDGVINEKQGGPLRLTIWKRDGTAKAQYAYPAEKQPTDKPGDGDSGVSEILAIDDTRFLALERSYTKSTKNFRNRLYEFDITGADDILKRDGLSTGGAYKPVTKRLVHVFDVNENLEALAFGPKLNSGECTLIVGADNNFREEQRSLFLAYAATGCAS